MGAIAIGCCVGSWEKFARWVAPRAFGPVLGLSGQSSICDAYNSIIDAFKTQGVDALVLVHDDLEITDLDAERKVREALDDPSVAIVGVDGGRGVQSISWWDYAPIGHQATDSGLVDFGQRSGDVDYIDGTFIALSRWAMENLRFDTEYGFHGYEDVCLAAKAAGKRVVAIDLDTHHHATLGFRSAEVHRQWAEANALFKRKWNL